MMVISLAAARLRAGQGRQGRFSNTIAIKARRENWKPKLATSRTEQSKYAQTIAAVAHASVRRHCCGARRLVSCHRHFAVFELFPVVPSCIGKGRFASDPDNCPLNQHCD
jgi:hypothetical protein